MVQIDVQRIDSEFNSHRSRSPTTRDRELSVQSVFANLLNRPLFTEPFICHPTVSAIKRLICIMRDHLQSISQFTIIMMIFQISSESQCSSGCFQQTGHRPAGNLRNFQRHSESFRNERFNDSIGVLFGKYCLPNIGIVHQNIQQKTFPDLSAIQTFRSFTKQTKTLNFWL